MNTIGQAYEFIQRSTKWSVQKYRYAAASTVAFLAKCFSRDA